MESALTLPEGARPDLLHRLVPRYAENRRLLLYVLTVVSAGIGLLLWQGEGLKGLLSPSVFSWLAITLLAEFLWLETITGDSTDSMASTANFAVLFLFGNTLSLWIIGLSVLLATRFIQKRDWVRAIFGFGQMTITAFLAGSLFTALHPGAPSLDSFRSLPASVAIVACGVVYFFVNTCLVTGALSLERNQSFWPAWFQNYGYRNAVISSVALFALSPLLLISYLSVGYGGVALFFLPLLIIKNQNREYINLQKMTQAMISTERMAAKGEMAAEVAHEINNYLGVLSGRAQLLVMKANRIGDESMRGDADIIHQQVGRMSTLAKGLLDFSHKEVRLQRFDLNRLVLETLDFVHPQNIFDGVTFQPELDPEVGEVEADQGQLQQVLINLLRNAADAMRERTDTAVAPPRIVIRSEKGPKGSVRVSVVDNGPGMSKAVQAKVFEPAFTTKRHGHGYGLATCYRILHNHGGKIWVESEQGQGAVFTLEFPRRSRGGTEPLASTETNTTSNDSSDPGRSQRVASDRQGAA